MRWASIPFLFYVFGLCGWAGNVPALAEGNASHTKCDSRTQVQFITNYSVTSTTDSSPLFANKLDNGKTSYGAGVVSACDDNSMPVVARLRNQSAHRAALEKLGKDERTCGAFVPGFGTEPEAAMGQAARLQLWAGLPRSSITMLWASEGYVRDVSVEDVHGTFVADGLLDLLALPHFGNRSCALYCYSRGCGVLLNGLDALGKQTPDQRLLHKVRHIVMINPDMPPELFVARFSRVEKYLGIGVTIYSSTRDLAFRFKDTFGGGMTLGVPVAPKLPTGVEVVDTTKRTGMRHSAGFADKKMLADMAWSAWVHSQHSPHRKPRSDPDANMFELTED